MSKTSRTNQVLYFARISLQSAADADSAQLKTKHEEEALFHLYGAVMSLCAELVGQYNLAPFKTLPDLFAQDTYHGELVELKILFDDGHSWLNQLIAQYERCLLQGLISSPVNASLITSQSDYSSLFANWLIQLEKLIYRMREHWQES